MPYIKQSLQTFYNLSREDVDETLRAGQLSTERDEYTDEEIQSAFDVIRSYLASGQASNYQQAAELFKQSTSAALHSETAPHIQDHVSNNGKNPCSVMSFSAMRDWVSETIGVRVSWKEAGEVLLCCGLPDQDEYSESEAERFLEACDLHKNQGKTHTEISAHFGLSLDAPETDLLQQVDDATDLIQEEVSAATDEMVQQKAEEHALNDYRRYVGHYAQALRSGRKVQEFLNDFRSYSKDRLEGKPQQVRLKSATPILILPSDTTSMNSSENSSNGMTNE